MIKLAVLSGGASPERAVSVMSVSEIIKHINREKYDVRIIDLPADGGTQWVSELILRPPDVVLSGLHGGLGENGAVQGLLECLDIPYAGSGVLASAICMDKAMSKLIMRACNIPVVDDVFINRKEYENDGFLKYEEKLSALGFPLVVKPNRGGSSLGVAIVRSAREAAEAAAAICAYNDDILIEKYIEGKEITIGIVETASGLDILPILDIESENAFFDYEAKYTDNKAIVEFSGLHEYQQVMLREITKKAFRVLQCTGYGRLDLIIREEEVYVLEMNTLPGLTSHSLIPMAAGGLQTSYGEFLDKLIMFALKG